MGISSITGGGLDVQGIVSQLMYLEREPIRRLDSQRLAFQKQAQAFDTVSGKLNSFYSAIEALKNASGFGAKSAVSSDESILTASATSGAVTGVYDLVVERLATVDTHQSTLFDSTSQTLTAGTFDIQTGSGSAVQITVDASNNTLEGLKDAINDAETGVRAIITSQNGQYRLGLISQTSGTAGQITIGNFSSGDLESELAFEQVAGNTGEDAQFKLNGMILTSSSNTATDAIDGLTIELKTVSASHVSLEVANDNEAVREKIESFVSNYNDVINYLNSQFKYSSTPASNSPLAGNSTLRRIQDQVLSIASQSVPSLGQDIRNLRQIGINMANDGTLSVDGDKLDDSLDDYFDQVRNLFQDLGTTSDNRVTYISSSSKTLAGTYSVNITQAATQAVTTGALDLAGALGADETMHISLNGSSLDVSLSAGQTLAGIIGTINAQAISGDFSVRARTNGDRLELYSLEYGSAQQLSVSDEGNLTGYGTTIEDSGQDVAGSIGGGDVRSGSGQYLAGGSGTGTEGLSLLITASSVPPGGSLGSVTLSLGYAELLSRRLDYFTDTINGPIFLAKNSISNIMKGIDDRKLDLESQLEIKENVLLNDFSRADQALRSMNSVLASLTRQSGSL